LLNAKMVRSQLADVRKARADLRERDNALQAIENSLLRWLDLAVAESGEPLPLTFVRPATLPERNTGGKMLLKDAVLLVLRNRAGSILNTEEILEAAKAMGAESRSKTPLHVVEWIIQEARKYANAPVEKIRPHHYTWVRPETASEEVTR